MSLSARIWARGQRAGSGTRKLVLLTLAENADDSGVVVATLDHLAREAELSRYDVQRTLRELEATGFVVTVHQFDEHGTVLPSRLVLPYGEKGLVASLSSVRQS